MGQAKLRRMMAVPTVYHHTSTLRTNLLWMSGVIELEGRGQTPRHPELGDIRHGAPLRRQFRDFPPLAWFTTKIEIPQCLRRAEFYAVDAKTGEQISLATMSGLSEVALADGISLHRMALGFRVSDVPVRPWPSHPGYVTDEGKVLNESARALGDDPDDWYVSDEPVDIAKISEFWGSRSILNPKLARNDQYLNDIKRMVELCRTSKAYIPPTWMKESDIRKVSANLGIPVVKPR